MCSGMCARSRCRWRIFGNTSQLNVFILSVALNSPDPLSSQIWFFLLPFCVSPPPPTSLICFYTIPIMVGTILIFNQTMRMCVCRCVCARTSIQCVHFARWPICIYALDKSIVHIHLEFHNSKHKCKCTQHYRALSSINRFNASHIWHCVDCD